jgi:hypothetical protein
LRVAEEEEEEEEDAIFFLLLLSFAITVVVVVECLVPVCGCVDVSHLIKEQKKETSIEINKKRREPKNKNTHQMASHLSSPLD